MLVVYPIDMEPDVRGVLVWTMFLLKAPSNVRFPTSSSGEVRIRVPFFSVVYSSKGPLPTKKETVKGHHLLDLVP